MVFVSVCMCLRVYVCYLFVSVVIGVDVVVKLLVSEVLLVTQLTEEVGLGILKRSSYTPFSTIL